MRVIRENQTKLASLGRMFFILQEAKKMEEQEKEMKERILVLDMLLSQLKNKKQILETEAQKKKVQDEYISKTKRIMQENKIRLLALGRQFYELVEAKIERQRQEERIYKIRIITETKIKLVTMGRQFYELEGEGEKDKEKANDILKKLDNKLDSIKKNIEQIKQAKESKGKQANEQQTNAPRNILEREIFGIGDEEIEESPEKPESPRNTDTENIFDIDIDI